jgi:hypothetical protein
MGNDLARNTRFLLMITIMTRHMNRCTAMLPCNRIHKSFRSYISHLGSDVVQLSVTCYPSIDLVVMTSVWISGSSWVTVVSRLF